MLPHLKRTHYIQLAAVSIVLLFLVVFVPVSTVLNNQEGNKKLQRVATNSVDPFLVLSGITAFDGVVLLGNVTGVDVVGFTFKVHFVAFPWGRFDIPDQSPAGNAAYNRLATDATLIVAGRQTSFKAGTVIPSFDAIVPIDEGQPNLYPFDKYYTTFDMSLFVGSSFNESIPMAIGIVGAVQSWTVGLSLSKAQGTSGLVLVDTTINRSWTTKFFSMIVVIIMWALSLAVFTLAITLWLRDRKVEPPTIAITASLLFALPALRNSQPGAPVIGSSVDVAGFMWNMVLVAVSCFLLIVNYVIKYTREKPANPSQSNNNAASLAAPPPAQSSSVPTVVKATGMQHTAYQNNHSMDAANGQNTRYSPRSAQTLSDGSTQGPLYEVRAIV
ncbi:hypothetical protein BASA50_006934 [Batrachochytrium salamandrivorans]|uniref:Uncharacterized protein n=1 Tax=Batrachochytrium salamandrivorans TaxID=1357716 RepID=A0ABQ8F8G6_9FUNG|nr:hypothetical protein BASA62_009304 [Batrachochytrium salamandrivorans]KAH6585188.1 hypothetical protein BASA60_000651 [Batrachochytrium salamandrivorans]KAH6594028.1 hypothetical protein BASA50_006934 [Batrachochytrium salamandrivorans]KAH9270686.1 hypothetical protein BASA83_007046 [Batrachochytrium salamandrivorans]KAJ1344718.1 hypothetical protein BSLG_000241 [Batrachochytrium salamandrivorans]